MEMPNPRRKKNVPDAPRLQTRKSNQNAHPGNIAKSSRRTPEEMEAARASEAAEKAATMQKGTRAISRVAAIEDEQRAVDQTYDETANHPIDPPRPARRAPPPATKSVEEDQDDDRDSDSADPPRPARRASAPETGEEEDQDDNGDSDSAESGDGAAFVPQHSSDEDGGEEEDFGDDEDEQEVEKARGRSSKPVKPSRKDVTASRSTKDSSGTPVDTSKEGSNKRKASAEATKHTKKKSKKVKLGKGGLVAKAKQAASSAGAAGDDGDVPMSQFGGPALDDDEHEDLERPVVTGKAKKKGLPKDSILDIVAVPPKPLTKKEQRGNARKWTLNHLPQGTAHQFTTEVVPLAREKLGALAPWAKLSVAQIQTIVNKVYEKKEKGVVNGKPKPIIHKVTDDGVWAGLLAYRTHDWHSGFAAQSAKAMDALIQADGDDSEEESDQENDPAQPAETSQASPDAAAADPAPAKSRGFKLKTPEGRAQFVKWALQVHEASGTSAFHWQQWGDGKDKKGFFLSIPPHHPRSDEHPSGALLLAVQAVERNLKYWSTGEYTVPKGLAGQFSFDNYGDVKKRISSTKNQLIRRATKFLSVVQKWDDARWEELRVEAAEWQDKRKRAASSSRGTSEAEPMEDTDEEPEVVVLSD
ncbi:hypothetical protein FB451DRAFT_1550594 [Mycena latifolia]|nr:hypothetical protein FB451DRAFT_1550594 [Mycena latifolia]